MFTINMPFEDALRGYESILADKPAQDPLRSLMNAEFSMYARRKAKNGDANAEIWLMENQLDLHEEQNKSSPMRHFRNPKKGRVYFDAPEEGTAQDLLQVMQVLELDEEEEDAPSHNRTLEEILQPLNNLIGLQNVKQEIQELVSYMEAQKKRQAAGLKPLESPALHMAFTGNPGSGKTTVARLLGKIFKDLGYLSKSRVVEVDRSELVGEYIGETAQKTRRILEKAHGGVLFIDEAYALTWSDSPRDYGHEAISTILKYMEDYRNDLIVIVAGYKEPMQYFLRGNPGLKSRFPILVDFPDFETGALVDIFKNFCADNELTLSEEASARLPHVLKQQRRESESDFANGRAVRTLFEKVLRRQSRRIVLEDLNAPVDLQRIEATDLSGDAVHSPDHKVVYLAQNPKSS